MRVDIVLFGRRERLTASSSSIIMTDNNGTGEEHTKTEAAAKTKQEKTDQDFKESKKPEWTEKSASKQSEYVPQVEAIAAKCKATHGDKLSVSDATRVVDELLAVEKSARLSGDLAGVRTACLAILAVSKSSGSWSLVNENIMTLSKRRSQLRQAVAAIVTRAMEWLEEASSQEGEKEKLIRTLLAVTAGKIFVEVERARLTRMLARMKEEAGDVGEAAEVMQDVAVETFGAMAKTEKIDFILEQVRLCLDKKDFVRAQILAKKIAPRALTSEEVASDAASGPAAMEAGADGNYHVVPALDGTPPLSALRVRYYELMIRYYSHTGDSIECCRCYRAIAEDKGIQEDEAKWRPILEKTCWFVVLSQAGPAQRSLLELTNADKRLDDLPLYKRLLMRFTTKEVIDWKELEADCKAEMEAQKEVFGADDDATASSDNGEGRKKDLRDRVVEHNIIVVATYYTRITIARLASLLDLDEAGAESHLSKMVVNKSVAAKIDRPRGIITFTSGGGTDDMLNNWAGNIAKLLSLVEVSNHRLNKDIQASAAAAEA